MIGIADALLGSPSTPTATKYANAAPEPGQVDDAFLALMLTLMPISHAVDNATPPHVKKLKVAADDAVCAIGTIAPVPDNLDTTIAPLTDSNGSASQPTPMPNVLVAPETNGADRPASPAADAIVKLDASGKFQVFREGDEPTANSTVEVNDSPNAKSETEENDSPNFLEQPVIAEAVAPESSMENAGLLTMVDAPIAPPPGIVDSDHRDESATADIDQSKAAPTARIDHASDVAADKRVIESHAPAPLADQIHEHLAAHLAQLREAGHMEVHMSLNPPELGPVQLHLDLDGGNLKVQFLAENDVAKQALEQQLEPLRVRFEEMGLSLTQFDVRRDGASSQGQQGNEQERGTFAPVGRRGSALTGKPYFRLAKPSGRVDVFA